jgi:hypothetical protein
LLRLEHTSVRSDSKVADARSREKQREYATAEMNAAAFSHIDTQNC